METREDPVYQMYSVLCAILQMDHFTEHNAELAMKFYNDAVDRITLENVSVESMERWYREFKDESLPGDPGAEVARIIVKCCRHDLWKKRQSPYVSRLFAKFKEITGVEEEDIII